MVVVRDNWAEWVRPGARKAFHDEYPELPAQYPSLFNIMTSQRAFEEEIISAGFGTAGVKPESQDVPMDKPFPVGKVKFVHLTLGLGFEISRESVEDDLYAILSRLSSKDLARSLRDAEERGAASVFNLAFTTQQAYDGVSLINTAHPIVAGGTQSNRPAVDVDLSVTSLQAALEHFMDMENERGLKIDMNPQMVVVRPENFWLVNEILGSEFKPFTADNEINVLRSQGLTPFIYRYLTDTDSWYVLADKSMHKLIFNWRRKPLFEDDFDKKAGVAFYMATERFSHGAADWRGIYGSPGA